MRLSLPLRPWALLAESLRFVVRPKVHVPHKCECNAREKQPRRLGSISQSIVRPESHLNADDDGKTIVIPDSSMTP